MLSKEGRSSIASALRTRLLPGAPASRDFAAATATRLASQLAPLLLEMQQLVPLLADIVQRHDIPRANVVGHSDIAPARKEDPGELFDWDLLAAHRLALKTPRVRMPSPYENDGAFFLALERFGYDISDQPAAMRAFQRRWRPHIIDGQVDGECSAILFALLLDRDEGRTR